MPDQTFRRKQKGKGYLKLELEFCEEALLQTQIEEIMRTLTTLGRKANLRLLAVDWLGFQANGSAATFLVRAV